MDEVNIKLARAGRLTIALSSDCWTALTSEG